MTVILYAKPGCPQCEATRRQLEKCGIEYQTIDVTVDTAAYESCKALGYSSAPVIVFGNQHWSGFRPDRISALVGVA